MTDRVAADEGVEMSETDDNSSESDSEVLETVSDGPQSLGAEIDVRDRTDASRSSGWLAVGLAVGSILSAVLSVRYLSGQDEYAPVQVGDLAGLLIGGLLTFLFGIAAIVATFDALGLSQSGQPLGLPSGSVQAFIALFLILLFFIMSTFLYLNVSQTNTDPILRNLTAEEVGAIPTDQIAATTSTSVEVLNIDGDPTTEERFNVVLALPARSEIAEEIARQLITTIGTLIVAIAAFYFGAKSIGGSRD